MLTTEQIKEIIVKELPVMVENDPEIHRFFLTLSRRHFADKIQTEDRFDRAIEELQRERERQDRKWEEQNQKWEEQNRKWHEMHLKLNQDQQEQNRKWEEQNQKLGEQNQKLEVQNQKWEAQNQKWEAQNQKWEANQQVINGILTEIKLLARKQVTTVGALGSRRGLHTEQAFRSALKGILEEFAGVEVLNVTEYDNAGVVFGKPDQIELDVIIKNGMLIIAEIKSSMSRSDMYIFERKVRFYEKHHQRKASELIVISPMVEPKAIPVAEKLGIKIYSSAEDVKIQDSESEIQESDL